MKKFWKEFEPILLAYMVWRLLLFFVAFVAGYFIPIFGAKFPYYDRVLEITHLPNWIWGFGNFDGVHYLRIAQDGYAAQYSQAFFPLYPILIRIFSFFFPKNNLLDPNIFTDPAFFFSGLVISNILFLCALYMLYKLVKLDFNKKIAFCSVIFLLVFPTSFYFGAIYSESLFLLILVCSIYLIRKKYFYWSAILISLATSARIVGIFLIPLYLIEVVKSKNWRSLYWLLVTPLGIAAYMIFLKINFNDSLYFLTSQPVFGSNRSANEIVLLPQVIYRYFNIFTSVKLLSLPFFTALSECIFTLLPLVFFIIYFKKMRLSYWFFSIFTLFLPTLTGTFSSMPRYALLYLVLGIPVILNLIGKYKIITFIILSLFECILLSLFIRGYWVA